MSVALNGVWPLLLASIVILTLAVNTTLATDYTSILHFTSRFPRQIVSGFTPGKVNVTDNNSTASESSDPTIVTESTPGNVSATTNSAPQASDLRIVAETFHLLNKGETFVQLPEGQDVVFVLGNTGSGKSTLILLLAADNKNLIAYRKTGQYLIKDDNQKIGTKAFESKTIYPELIWSSDRRTAFIDCPGFKDTRNVSYEIAGSYLIKRALDNAHRVKLIFTVTYSSVENRNDFPELLNHASKLIKNIDIFNNSIGLVVTRVPSEPYVNDTQMKSDIAEIFYECKEFLRAKIPETDEEKALMGRKIQLIDIFLSMNGNEYNKFELFRKPDKAGPLSESELLQNGKKNIEKLVQESIEYVLKSTEDFGFTFSSDAKIEVSALIHKIKQTIARNVQASAVTVKEHFQTQEKNTYADLLELQYLLKQASDSISILFQDSSNSSNSILSKLANVVYEYHMYKTKHGLKNLLNNLKYFKFFQAVSDRELTSSPTNTKQFKDLEDYVSHSKNWYDFLVNLQSKLSEYGVQKDTSRYNVADLKDWGMPGKPQGIRITGYNLQKFLDHCSSLFDISYKDHVDAVMNDSTKLSVLNNILNYTLMKHDDIKQEGEILMARGNFIKLSKVAKDLGKEVKRVEIYAVHAVFIDTDLMLKGRGIDVYILSLKWVIVGTRRIELDGKDREAYDKARSGSGKGGHGKNGKSGNPGGRAGNFFGFGKKFINGSHLTVTANGGNGGPGQDGGDGADGADGTTPPKPPKNWSNLRVAYFNTDTEDHYKGWPLKASGDGSMSCTSVVASTACHSTTDFNVTGTNGTAGGNGGDGGLGGAGYTNGRVQIASINETTDIITSTKNGTSGPAGYGGIAGRDGQPGCLVKFQVHIEHAWILAVPIFTKYYVYKYVKECNEIIPAKKGDSKIHAVETTWETQYYVLSPSNAVNKLKTSFRENMFDQKRGLSEIFNEIDESTQVTSLYDIKGFVDELLSLETQFYNLRSRVDFLPFYDSFLKRLLIFKSKVQSINEHLKVWNYLYTTCLSKVLSLRRENSGFHVIDIKTYLGIAIANVDSWRNLNVKYTVQNITEEFQSNFDKKISSAEEFIENQITVEIDNVNNQIEGQIDKLLDEVLEQRRGAEEKKRKTEEMLVDLKRALAAQKALGIFKIFSSVLSFVGPMGKVAEELIRTGTTAREAVEQIGNKLKTSGITELATEIQKVSTISDSVQFAISKNADLERKIAVVSAEIEGVKEVIMKLNQKEESIYNAIQPMIRDMDSIITDLLGAFAGKSQVGLDVAKWQIQCKIRDMKSQLQQMTQGFDMQENLVRCLERLDEAMTVMITVYDRIQNYQDQKNLAEYIAKINSAEFVDIIIQDNTLDAAVTRLQLITQTNIILSQYERAFSSFKQFVFPFANVFLKEFTLPSDPNRVNSTDVLVNKAVVNLKSLKSKITETGAVINDKIDNVVFKSSFYSKSTTISPFHVWESVSYKDEISQLLSGKAVPLKAAVRGNKRMNVVKFNRIGLRLRSVDSALQSQLDSALDHFHVNMTHLGNSYYRCDDKYFLIPSESFTLSYSFLKENNVPVSKNIVYDKLLNGDLTLSPYAMWTIQLYPSPHSEAVSDFRALDKYKQLVDLELEGEGTFVKNEAPGVCDSNLEDYYTLVDSLSDLNNDKELISLLE